MKLFDYICFVVIYYKQLAYYHGVYVCIQIVPRFAGGGGVPKVRVQVYYIMYTLSYTEENE